MFKQNGSSSELKGNPNSKRLEWYAKKISEMELKTQNPEQCCLNTPGRPKSSKGPGSQIYILWCRLKLIFKTYRKINARELCMGFPTSDKRDVSLHTAKEHRHVMATANARRQCKALGLDTYGTDMVPSVASRAVRRRLDPIDNPNISKHAQT